MRRWLKEEAKGWQVAAWVILTAFLSGCWSLLVLVLLFLTPLFKLLDSLPEPEAEWFDLIVMPPIEEILCRLTLIFVIKRGLRTTLKTAAVLSTLFALIHLANLVSFPGWNKILLATAVRLLLQGSMGLSLSLLFLKCGGFRGRKVKPLLASISAHYLYNAQSGLVSAILSLF